MSALCNSGPTDDVMTLALLMLYLFDAPPTCRSFDYCSLFVSRTARQCNRMQLEKWAKASFLQSQIFFCDSRSHFLCQTIMMILSVIESSSFTLPSCFWCVYRIVIFYWYVGQQMSVRFCCWLLALTTLLSHNLCMGVQQVWMKRKHVMVWMVISSIKNWIYRMRFFCIQFESIF